MRRLVLLILIAVAGCAPKPIQAEFREIRNSDTGKTSYAVFLYPTGDKKDVRQISFLCEKGEPIFFSVLLSHPISRQARVTLAFDLDGAQGKAYYAIGDESGGVWFEKDREGSTVRKDWTQASKLALQVSVNDGLSYDATFDISSFGQLTDQLDAACRADKGMKQGSVPTAN